MIFQDQRSKSQEQRNPQQAQIETPEGASQKRDHFLKHVCLRNYILLMVGQISTWIYIFVALLKAIFENFKLYVRKTRCGAKIYKEKVHSQ